MVSVTSVLKRDFNTERTEFTENENTGFVIWREASHALSEVDSDETSLPHLQNAD